MWSARRWWFNDADVLIVFQLWLLFEITCSPFGSERAIIATSTPLSALIYRRPYDIMFHMIKSIVDSTKVVPCLLFDEIEILIPDDSLSICPSLDNSGVFIRYKNKEKLLYWRSSSNLSGCAKALCPFHSSIHWLNFCAYHYFFMTCNIEYLFLLPVIPRKCVFCLRHFKILWFCQ